MSCDLLKILGIFPHEIGENNFFTLGLRPIFGPKKNSRKITASILTPFSELLPNLSKLAERIQFVHLIFKL
jgi:hypothetical protein